jgi:molybdate transport system permease protein
MRDALLLSLKTAGLATILSVIIGTGIAYVLARRRFPGRRLAEGLTLLPLVLPPTVLGYYLLVAMGRDTFLGRWYRWLTGADLVFDFSGIVVAACVSGIPLFIRQAQVAFAGVDPELETSARAYGAGEWQVFFYITVPLARRGLIAGTVLAFARALGEFGATFMVGANIPGRTRTLPLAVYNAWLANDDATALGLCLLLSGIALTVAVLATHLSES